MSSTSVTIGSASVTEEVRIGLFSLYIIYVRLQPQNELKSEALKKDDEFSDWVSSTFTTLSCIGKDIDVCSISIVPEHLIKSNKDAYSPKIVSIGPMHRKTKRDLLYTKEAKWRSMLSLLYRNKTDEETREALERCMNDMHGVEEAVRANYVDDDLKLVGRYDMAKIMLLDGCFLLELLISHDQKLNDELKCRLKPPFDQIKKKKEELLSDLVLLENQIPLLVLRYLFDAIFPGKLKEEGNEATAKRICKLVLSLFSFSFDSNSTVEFYSVHLLDLLHSFMTRELEEPKIVGATSSSRDWKIDMDKEDDAKEYEILELKRCATKLHASGVTIEPKKNKCPGSRKNDIGINFDIKFNERKKSLKIPKLRITRTTEAKWRNFIAWEHNRCDRTQITPLMPREKKVNCKFSLYALFIQGLICCEHDIQLLKDKGVIVVDDDVNSGINQDKEKYKEKKKKNKKKGMSNKELMIILNNIADGVDRDKIYMDISFGKLFNKLNKHQSTRNCFTENVILFWHWLRCFFTTSIRYKWEISYDILKKEYTPTMWKKIGVVYACILLGLSIAQLVLKLIPAI
ncbi:hypothetical protein PIB30_083128 [Stylosanthes scabra]|uniref:Uncharacterized protein n=1 Tax=Stylosanthes scabra TaxID=79078 RepID=A0ABU6VU83_9FABA|nr:hypothetical protein [Stylosanthes scabra]